MPSFSISRPCHRFERIITRTIRTSLKNLKCLKDIQGTSPYFSGGHIFQKIPLRFDTLSFVPESPLSLWNICSPPISSPPTTPQKQTHDSPRFFQMSEVRTLHALIEDKMDRRWSLAISDLDMQFCC